MTAVPSPPPPCDAAFAGGGISSMIAALEILEAGGTATIVERNARDGLGGQCRDAFGGFFFADSPEQRRFGIRDSAELAWEDWEGYADFAPEDHWQRRWARRYVERAVPDVRGWLRARGLRLFATANWAERAHDGKGNRVPRFHLLWGCGPALVDAVEAELRRYEGGRLRVLPGHTAGDLVRTGGAVTGLRAVAADGREVEIAASHTVIGTGGFTGDAEKVRAHWPADPWGAPPDDLLCGVWPWSDGAMVDVAAAHGGRVAGLENMWVYVAGVTHWKGDHPTHGLALIPPKSALWLRADGRRFDPPLLAGGDTRDAVARVVAGDNPRPYSWLLLNRRILVRELTLQGARFNDAFRERSLPRVLREVARGNPRLAQEFLDRCPDAVAAPDLPELIAKMAVVAPGQAIDAAGLRADIARYDAQIRLGGRFHTDPQLEYLGAVRAFLNDKLRTAPFVAIGEGGPAGSDDELVAIRIRPTVRKSLGGLVTDDHCRVRDGADKPVVGLLAIGESAGFGGGGMNGRRTLEGTLLGGCVLTARQAAATVLGRTFPAAT